jgi:outer membrane protein OmpA-like peptidoglycan-associated protein
MIVSLPSRGIGAAFAVGLLLAGCSSDSDVPTTVASSPDGGTQVNTDTGSGGEFPDVNSVPNQRPTSTIQDLNQAPEGLSGAQSGTQYGERLVGGPTSSAEPPAPPPPPEPAPQEQLAPIPEAGIQTQSSNTFNEPAPQAPAPEVAAAAEPIATPEVTEPQPMEPVAEATPAPAAPEGEGQTIQGTTPEGEGQTIQGTTQGPSQDMAAQPAPDNSGVQAAPIAAAPQQPATPASTPQEGVQPFQSEAQLPSGSVQTQSVGATQSAQLPASAYGPNHRALAPDAYGVSVPQPVLPPYQTDNPAQATYRSPYATPTVASYGQQAYGGQPVGLIYFGEGSSRLSSDDMSVLKQIAEMQRASGGVVHVVGHASMGTGTMDQTRHQQANQRVSEARANAVAQQLMEYGVPRDAIQTAAAGDTRPLHSEAMPSGEAANRRAEVYLGVY